MSSPTIELLWWAGCPSTERARELLQAALIDAGLSGTEIRMVELGTDADAATRRFRGSPTILIDGVDLTALVGGGGGEEEPVGLSCRLYRRRDGRISPVPDPEDLRDALRAARDAVLAGSSSEWKQ